MKSIVVYFSQTGNTEKVANAIQGGIKLAAGSCDILKIKDANPKRLYEYDLIGIGSPVFEVINVWEFIKDLRFIGGKHVFLFCTHGSAAKGGNFFYNAYKRLKPHGITLIGTADWYGDCYLLHHTYPYPSKGHPDEIDLKEAEDFGREIVLRSWKIAAGETALIPPEPEEFRFRPPEGAGFPGAPPGMNAPPPTPDGKLPAGAGFPGAPPGMNAPLPTPDGKPPVLDILNSGPWKIISSLPTLVKYHKEKCLYPKCRLCMENCPVEGIDLSVDPPILAKPCEYCEFCGRVCPTGAIDIDDWIKAVAKITGPTYGAYEHAEKEGIFRRLTPKEELNPEIYGHMVVTKHPYWIIGKGHNKSQ